MHSFDYEKPIDLKDALTLRKKWGNSSRLLLGGTDLLIAIDNGILTPEILIDLKGIKELNNLEETDSSVTIGAGVTYSDLINSPFIKKNYPAIWESSRLVASVGIRNVATLVGNICNAVPSAESSTPLLIRDAIVKISSIETVRSVPITEFFTGPRSTVVKENEIVTSVFVPAVKTGFGESYVKLGRYRGQDIAQAAVSVHVDSHLNYRIAYAAVGPVPLRIPDAESLLKGKDLSPELLKKAEELIINTISPITDIRASKEYRIHMCQIMFEKAITVSISRMKTSQPEYGKRLI